MKWRRVRRFVKQSDLSSTLFGGFKFLEFKLQAPGNSTLLNNGSNHGTAAAANSISVIASILRAGQTRCTPTKASEAIVIAT